MAVLFWSGKNVYNDNKAVFLPLTAPENQPDAEPVDSDRPDEDSPLEEKPAVSLTQESHDTIKPLPTAHRSTSILDVSFRPLSAVESQVSLDETLAEVLSGGPLAGLTSRRSTRAVAGHHASNTTFDKEYLVRRG